MGKTMVADAPQSKQNTLTLRDLEVLTLDIEGKTGEEIAEKVGVSRKTVVNTKAKPAYRDLMIGALEVHKFGVNDIAKKLVSMTDAQKAINVDGTLEIVEDNTTQLGAVRKLCDIFGVDAPKELDIKATTAAMTNEELLSHLSQEIGVRKDQMQGVVNVPTGQDKIS